MTRRILRGALLAPLCLLLSACGEGKVSLPAVFTDHAVFQRGQEVPVWGTAAPHAGVTVSFAGQRKYATADEQGRWMVRLDPLPAGGPHELTIASRLAYVTRRDILVGEVWICSGQSNMEWPLARTAIAVTEVPAATYPDLRLFTVPKRMADVPQTDVVGQWSRCSPETAKGFSAVGYFFGRQLHKTLNVPVGLINASWGGSRAEPWTPRKFLQKLPAFQPMLADLDRRRADFEKRRGELMEQYEQAKRNYAAAYQEFLKELARQDAGSRGGWERFNLDISEWRAMLLPQLWEQTEVGNFDGVVWFRKEVDVPASWAGRDVMLSLGPIDDDDVTYVNGEKVGAIGYGHPNHYRTPRRYRVPGRLVKAGRNVIACRVLDGGGGGGIYGRPEQMELSPADGGEAVPLAGSWRYRIGCGRPSRAVPRVPRPPRPPTGPGGMYNGMIAPLVPYGIAGAIWYQGESNAAQPITYRELFPAMIRSWRDAWGRDIAFCFVQLANFMKAPEQPEEGGWAWLREAQAKALSLPKTGMAVTTDIGEANDIHPRNKQDVGKRLALAALRAQYGRDLVHSGPVQESMKVEGSRIRLTFRHVGAGLVARDGVLRQFAIAAADGKFVWADARIERSPGPSGAADTVVVWSDEVKSPAAVRYAWANNPHGCSLYNREGLPAAPFRTDDWGTAERAAREQPRR